jgi:hypothetical protein
MKMSKRFDIILGLEELLEVDKVAEATIEEKETPDSEKVLDKAVSAAEEPAAEETPADTEEKIDEASDTPVEVPEDKTTLDGSEPTEDKEEVKETSEEETTTEVSDVETTLVEEKEETGDEDKTEEIEEVKEEIKEDSDEGDEPTETTSMSDVADDIKEDENNDAEVADANDAVATLESIAEELETSLDTGGLSPAAAEITDIAVRSICSRVGIPPTEQEVISIEGFKTASSRIRNTKVAIENIQGYLVTLWQAFVTSIKRGIEWIKNFMATIFNDYHKFKKDIKNLKEAANKIQGKNLVVSKLKFEKAAIIDLLRIGTGTQDVSGNIKKLTDFTKSYFGLVETQRTSVIKNIELIINNFSKDGIAPSRLILSRLENSFIIKGNLAGYLPLKDTVECYYSRAVLPGNHVFLAYYPSEQIDLNDSTKLKMFDDALKDSKFSFEIRQGNNATPVLDLPFLPKAELLVLLSNLDSLCDEALSSQKIFEKFVKEKSVIQRSLEQLIKNQNNVSKLDQIHNKVGELAGREKETNFDGSSAYTSVSSRMTMLKNTYENGSSKLSALILKTIKGGLAYATECIDENIKASQQILKTP